MKCDWVQQNILFYVYNELEDDARYEVEQHLARCPECASELKAARKFHATHSQSPVTEPTPNLLAASRMRLQEALETTLQGGFCARLILEPRTWLRQIRMAPALAAVHFHRWIWRRDWRDLQLHGGPRDEWRRDVQPVTPSRPVAGGSRRPSRASGR